MQFEYTETDWYGGGTTGSTGLVPLTPIYIKNESSKIECPYCQRVSIADLSLCPSCGGGLFDDVGSYPIEKRLRP